MCWTILGARDSKNTTLQTLLVLFLLKGWAYCKENHLFTFLFAAEHFKTNESIVLEINCLSFNFGAEQKIVRKMQLNTFLMIVGQAELRKYSKEE